MGCEGTEPHQRPVRTCAPRGKMVQMRLKAKASLVSQKTSQFVPCPVQVINPLERGCHLQLVAGSGEGRNTVIDC